MEPQPPTSRPAGTPSAALLSPPRSEPDREGGEAAVARARDAFLADGPVPPGVVRTAIMASWTRSRAWQVRPDQLELGLERDTERDAPLVRAAQPVVDDLTDLLSTEPVSVILCDAHGVVLSRWTGDAALESYLERVWLAPGFSYAEQVIGTNGIGTALEAGGPAEVYGHEHYASRLERLACAGVPLRSPLSGKVLGVIDLTCWQRHAGPLLLATAGTLARRIEKTLLEQRTPQQVAVLRDYLTACRRNRGPVLAFGQDLLMMNDQARLLLDPSDQEPLLAEVGEALASRRRRQLLVDLPSGRTARVYCRPTEGPDGVVGGVLDVQVVSRAASPSSSSPVLPSTSVGSSAVWRSCIAAVDRHQQAGQWLVLSGEHGSGREAVARSVHDARTPAARLRVLRAEEHGPDWVPRLAEELREGAGTVVLTDVDTLPAEVLAELAELLEPIRESPDAARPWVVVTVGPGREESGAEMSALLAAFPSTVEVPPLRRHLEDLPELVPHLLARVARTPSLSCSPEVVRLLARHRWPGNVDQLVDVLRQVVTRRRRGTIGLRDLPPECWATGRRQLAPLESLERDAIVQALLDAGGDKTQAARRLAMSRATIYRKIKGYGIVVPVAALTASEG